MKKFLIIIAVFLVGVLGLSALGFLFKPEESSKKPDNGVVDALPDNEGTETPGENETPEVPELLKRINLTLDNVVYANGSSDYVKRKSLVNRTDVPVANENIDGNVIKLKWHTGNTLSINVDLSKYDTENSTHLTFWVGSDVLNFTENSSVYGHFVHTPSKTIFSSIKRFKSSDCNLEEYLASHPSVNPDDVLKFGEWKKYEVPIADVLEFYEANGRITIFHFLSKNFPENNIYLANVQFEKIETIAE